MFSVSRRHEIEHHNKFALTQLQTKRTTWHGGRGISMIGQSLHASHSEDCLLAPSSRVLAAA
jgi:hypothetical protein